MTATDKSRAPNDTDKADDTDKIDDAEAKPAQVPGDAESPPKGTEIPAAKHAPDHTDPTEPTRTRPETRR